MEMMQQLLGRLHPLIVHLPIGFLILALLLQWYDRKANEWHKVIAIVYFWAGITAVFACITGYLQYQGEGYSYDSVKWHLCSGIITAVFCFAMYLKISPKKTVSFLVKAPISILSVIAFVLISFTGHQGGNITHGEAYLIEPLPNSVKSLLGFKKIEEKELALTEENWGEALVFEEVIQPILNSKCVSCHNPKKDKGALLLHSKEGILKGGESGAVLASHSEESDLYTRMVLPMEDDDHMPPEGKKQPTKEEIKLIAAWMDAGHPFEGTVKEIGLKKDLFISFFPSTSYKGHPELEVPEASQDSIKNIEKYGIYLDPISESTHFLSVSCINKPNFKDDDFDKLRPVREQIAQLDLGGTQVTDAIFEKLTQFPNLSTLKLDNTGLTGNGIDALKNLEYLHTINFSGSLFDQPVDIFSSFKSLEKVYLFKTKVDKKGPKSLKEGQLNLDYGGYELPPIPSDSIIY